MSSDLSAEVGKSIDKLRCYHFYIWGIYGETIPNYKVPEGQFCHKSATQAVNNVARFVHTDQLTDKLLKNG
jgi:hypothetical protein